MASAASKSLLRDALSATTAKDKGPPVSDGILSITPDTPEVVEWRRSALDITETSSTYLDDDDDVGPKPHELYGKFTWKIDNFSETSKRELRSNVFDVGGYKWYILVYPQGCDVCNHLSLFLCVADYDKLLPGWSHFSQFTIAVVNKDPKKSKYSDTLHRFCKKEHDWGWKKFMELSKVLDGFTVADTLVIKAQVQIILDKPSLPFRCLDPQYRRELVRVYLTNVEGVCRRFCDDKKQRLLWVKDEVMKFREFWVSLSTEQQRKLLSEKADGILKGLVKQFFNEKEVTSTLVMDALYSGCKQVEEHSRQYMEGKSPEGPPLVLIKAERNSFGLLGELIELADHVCKDFIPLAKDDQIVQPNDGLALRSGQDEDYRRGSIEKDEKRLAELGRKTVEMFVISHIITEKMEIAYRDAEALKRQDLLIAEEFETQQMEESKAKVQAEKEKEKKAKKKEKVKAKKDADRAKKDAEEVVRQKIDEVKRLDSERKAQEAAATEKKRQEEEQQLKAKQQAGAAARQVLQQAATASNKQQQQQQQQHAAAMKAKASLATASVVVVAPAQPSAAQRPLVHVKAPNAASLQQAASAGHGKQQQPLVSPKASAVAPPLSRPVHVLASTSPDASADPPSSSTGTEEAGGDSALSDTDDSSKDVGTVDQAIGAAGVDSEDEDEKNGSAGSTAAAAVTAAARLRATEADREVLVLRSRVRVLEKQLADRDADLFMLRAQLAELQLADAGRNKQFGPPQTSDSLHVAPSPSFASANGGNKPPGEKEAAPLRHGDAAKQEHAAAGPTLAHGQGGKDAYVGLPMPPPPPPLSAVPASGGPMQQQQPASRRPQGGVGPYDPAGAQARAQQQQQQQQSHASSVQQQRNSAGNAASTAAAHLRSGEQQLQPTAGAGAATAAPGSEGHQLLRASSVGYPHQSPGGALGIPGTVAMANGGRSRPDGVGQPKPPTGGAAAGQHYGAGSQAGHGAGGQSGHNGAAGILHTSDSASSYRNAAAGGGGAASSAGGGAANAAAAAMQQQQQRSGRPLIPVQGTPVKQKSHSQDEAATPTDVSGPGQQQQQQRGPLNHAAAEFTAGARLMMQQQQQQGAQPGMTFEPAAAKLTRQLDSPGLDDFAHMGLIDDLLTE